MLVGQLKEVVPLLFTPSNLGKVSYSSSSLGSNFFVVAVMLILLLVKIMELIIKM